MRPTAALAWAGGVSLAMATGSFLFQAFVRSIAVSHGAECWSNVKQLAQATLVYAEDSDSRFPLRDSWRAGLRPVLPSIMAFHCPALPYAKTRFGYAFNGALSAVRVRSLDRAERVPVVYDSIDPITEASDLVTSLPSPGRHLGKDNVGYADGHARRVAP